MLDDKMISISDKTSTSKKPTTTVIETLTTTKKPTTTTKDPTTTIKEITTTTTNEPSTTTEISTIEETTTIDMTTTTYMEGKVEAITYSKYFLIMIKLLIKQDIIFLKAFSHFFDSDEPCQNINVTIKNVALEAHQGVEGAYELNDYEINEKPSWKLISDIPPFWNVSYIWYIPQFKKWAVGPSDQKHHEPYKTNLKMTQNYLIT